MIWLCVELLCARARRGKRPAVTGTLMCLAAMAGPKAGLLVVAVVGCFKNPYPMTPLMVALGFAFLLAIDMTGVVLLQRARWDIEPDDTEPGGFSVIPVARLATPHPSESVREK